jgi:hypothetical protein
MMTDRMKALRPGRRSVCALGLAGLASGLPRYVRAAPLASDWFRYGPELAEEWTVMEVPGDPSRVILRSQMTRASGPRWRILVLYPRVSSAYDIAITTIAGIFDDKALDAELQIVNMNN